MTNQFYSKRTEQFMKNHNRNLMIEGVIKTCILMSVPVCLVILIVLDWLRVFRLSWLIG